MCAEFKAACAAAGDELACLQAEADAAGFDWASLMAFAMQFVQWFIERKKSKGLPAAIDPAMIVAILKFLMQMFGEYFARDTAPSGTIPSA